MPALTIALPIHNAERFLAECIRSIQAQTFEDFEVLAVLDGCTDGSERILEEMRDSRYVTVKNDVKQGLSSVLNQVISQASTPLIARMDADDVMHIQRLERQYEFMLREPSVDILGTWFDYIDEHGKFVKKAFPFPTTHEEIKKGFRVRNSMGHPTVMYRTERIRQVGGYPLDFHAAEDLALWLKCLTSDFRFANLPEALHHYRVSEMQVTRTKYAEIVKLTNLAYSMYGRAIWGKDAPEFEFGLPLGRRALKRLRRILRMRSNRYAANEELVHDR
jgi:glycosyltransferase involved in cell wall biosynthesis